MSPNRDPDAAARRELSQHRAFASALLVAMAALTLCSYGLPWPNEYARALVGAAAKAGFVGGIADWFAVTALFRHPLGLPIPHTAIIPRQKERLGLALGRFVATHVFTERDIAAMLGKLDLPGILHRFLADPAASKPLAATLAYFLHLQGDAIGLLTFDEKVREYLPARHRSGHLRQLMFALEKPASGKATNLTTPVERITGLVRKRGLVAYVSDFLAPLERLEPSLLALTACGHEVTVFQVLDPAELTLNFEQAAVFEDIESEQTVYIDPAAARAEYLPRIEAHCAAVRATCQKLGIGYHRLSTEQPLELALFEFVQGRMRRGRLSRPSAPSRS